MKPIEIFVVSALSLALTALPSGAHARPGDKPVAASPGGGGGKAEFATGRAKFGSKDYAGALPFFRKAFEASGSPNASLYIGLCLVELGQAVEAYEVMATTARESDKRMAADPAYQHTNEVAKQTLAQLEKKVARVTVTVNNANGGAVTMNGKPLAPERLGTPVAVAPGKIVFVVTTVGQPELHSEVQVLAGEEKPVILRFEEHGRVASPAPVLAPVIEAPSRSAKMSTMRVVGLGVAGVGVVGLGVFAIAGLSSNAKFDDVKSHCTGRCTDPKYVSEVDSGKTLDTVANVGLVIGVAGLAGGAVLFTLGGRKNEPTAALHLGPREIGVAGTF